MNVIDIALRNMLANAGIPAEAVELVVDTNEHAAMQDLAASMLFGPFGNLVPIEDTISDDNAEATLDGYVSALEETIEHIDSATITVPCHGAAEAVHGVLEQLKTDIRARINEVDGDEPEAESDQLELPIFDLLQALGLNVQFVDLREQAAG